MKNNLILSAIVMIALFSCENNNKTIDLDSQFLNSLQKDTTYSHIFQDEKGWMIENNIFHLNEYGENQKTIFKINEVQTIENKSDIKEFSIQPIWSNEENIDNYIIQSSINTYHIQNELLTTRLLNNDDSEEFFSLYNLNNGNHLMDYTYAKLDVQFSQSDEKRHIGFVARSGLDTLKIAKNLFGTLTYTNQNQTIQKLLITLKDEENRNFISSNTPDMTLSTKQENTMRLNGDKTLYFSNLETSPQAKDIIFDIEMITYLTEDYESIPFTIAIIDDKINMDSTQYFQQIFNVELLEDNNEYLN